MLLVTALAVSAKPPGSVTLAWDSSTGNSIGGYRLYIGVASGTYTSVIDAGKATTTTVASLVSGATYFFAVTAYDTNGQESKFSCEVSCTVPDSLNYVPTSGSGLAFAAVSGTITAPFGATNGTVFQPAETLVADGGRAAYSFNIVNAGNYLVTALVSAPSQSQNSFYVNIDAEPTDPLMIWDIPVSTGLASHTVSWRGNGNGDPASSQYIPKVFTLSADTHQLIIRGREANVKLSTISITVAPPTLQVHTVPGGLTVLSGTGQAGQMYNVLCSLDLRTWTVVGTAKTDANGSFTFTDPAGNTRPSCMYRLQGR